MARPPPVSTLSATISCTRPTTACSDASSGACPRAPGSLTAFAGKLIFSADDANIGVELWQSDGTAAGTVLLRDLQPGAGSSGPDRLTVAGNTLWFRANTQSGVEPWVSDGTAAG